MAGIDVDTPGALEQAEKEGRVPHLNHEGNGPAGEKSLLAEMRQDFK